MLSFDIQNNLMSLVNFDNWKKFLCGYMRRDGHEDGERNQGRDDALMFGPDDDNGSNIPTQVETLVRGTATVATSEYKSIPDLDYLQELLAIQQQGPRAIGFFGTRNMGFMHQQLIEILSYAMVITKNHIFTSGASGTNAAVIRGALRAEKPELLTVILPQSLKKQPPESQELLSKVQNLIEKPQYDHLPLIEASRLCNMDIISKVQQWSSYFLLEKISQKFCDAIQLCISPCRHIMPFFWNSKVYWDTQPGFAKLRRGNHNLRNSTAAVVSNKFGTNL
uniref:Uncharacterized protein n=1 Tax=Oryza brachyantha TaxID=4533 RepID=J3KZI6_ORYBR